MSIRYLGVFCSLILLTSVGCGDPVDALGDGSLSLEWQVNPLGCAQAGVQDVQVNLYNAYRSYEEHFNCEDSSAIVSGIEAGTYELEVTGNNREGQAIFSVKPRKITVSAEKLNTTKPLLLSAKPAQVEVVWGFENGLVCGGNGVAEVEVAFYDDLSFEHHRSRVLCDAGSATIGGLVSGDYFIEVSSVESSEKFSGLETLHVERGAQLKVRVELKSRRARPNSGEY